MKTLKSVLVLLLAVLMCASCLTGCGSSDEEDKGAEINMYIASMPYDLDPARVQYDSDNLKFYSLIYESLFRINEDGELEEALVSDWEIEEDERTEKIKLILELKGTSWSDGVSVTANDVVYTFKRLLDPDNSNPAAALLYPIENAKAAKSGLMTIDDVGFSAVSSSKVEIIFEEGFTDTDYFLRTLANPVFTPMREDIILQYKDEWAQPIFSKEKRNPEKAFSSIVTNGPFVVREWSAESIVLERSVYYRNLDPEGDVTEYVNPFRIKLTYDSGSKFNNSVSADKQLENYNISADDENFMDRNFLIASFSKEGYDKVKGDVESFADGSMYTYYFNTTNSLLKDARVRKALSIALDRNEIAKIVGCGVVPATGYVPTGVEADNDGDNDYRDKAPAVISATGNLAEAKQLMSEAKAKGGKINIAVRKDLAWEKEVAEYVKGVWGELGFKVEISTYTLISSDKGVFIPEFEQKLASGDFDVIGADMCALSSDAYSFLVPFAREYSGSVVPVDDDAEPSSPHITGFDNEEYNTLIGGTYTTDEATGEVVVSVPGVLTAEDDSARFEIYKKAEAILAEQAPTAPLFFGVNNYLVSDDLSDISYTALGAPIFTETSLDDYEHYKLEAEEDEEEEVSEEEVSEEVEA